MLYIIACLENIYRNILDKKRNTANDIISLNSFCSR